MAKRILIALDESENAARVVSLVAETFEKDNEIILLSVLPKLVSACELNEPTLIAHFKSEHSLFCQAEEHKENVLGEALHNAKNKLLEAGFKESKISAQLAKQRKGIANDIVAKAQELNADIIVMGRRGISGLKEFFLGSVSHKVLQLCKDRSVLLAQ